MYISPGIPEFISYKIETLTFPTSEISGALKNQLENKWGDSQFHANGRHWFRGTKTLWNGEMKGTETGLFFLHWDPIPVSDQAVIPETGRLVYTWTSVLQLSISSLSQV